MLDDILKKEIDIIRKNCEADINSLKYIVKLVDMGYFKNKFKNYSEEEIHKEIKERLKEIHTIYHFGGENGIVSFRPEENIEKSVTLGFEEFKGSDENVLDGYFDPGKTLNLTSLGKEVLNGYRLSRGELSLEDNYKETINRICSLS